jgi:Kef-type K+ transport system membrane component KefB
VLGIVDPGDPIIHALAEIGVVVLLFATGLHTEVRSLVSVGTAAMTVALAGVALPFAGGYFAALAFGTSQSTALVCGAALCATSVGISARVLSDLRVMDTSEGRVVLGAAVIDDIVGLVILAVVAKAVAGTEISVGVVSQISVVAIGFVAVAVLIGGYVATFGYRAVQRFSSTGTLGLFALAFAFALAWLADLAGSAMIVGAFAAGLVLDDRHDRKQIEHATTVLGYFFVPIFFASVGAAVDLGAMSNPHSLALGAALIGCGIAGKVAAGYAPAWFRGDKLLVGVAMVPRGEVGLIFAQMGLAAGAINAGEFGALMLMVIATTFVTPPLLSKVASRSKARLRAGDAGTEGVGIDDLVMGTTWPEDTEGQKTTRETKVIRPK